MCSSVSGTPFKTAAVHTAITLTDAAAKVLPVTIATIDRNRCVQGGQRAICRAGTRSLTASAAVLFLGRVRPAPSGVEKAGRAVCLRCSINLRGFEYPLRGPSKDPLYVSGREIAEAMNIID